MKNIAIVLLLAVSLSASAQKMKDEEFFPDIANGIGGSIQKFDGLNSRIAGFSQYKKLPSYAATLNMGWLKERNRVISGAGLEAGSSMGGDRDKQHSTIRFVGAHADLGYDLIKSKNVMLYPLVGLGYERYQARYFQDNSSVDFNNVVQSPAAQNAIRPLELTNSFFTYRLGVGVAVKCPQHPASSIGLQAGYTGSFKSHDWKSNEGQSLQNSPEDKLSRIYFGLIFIFRPSFMKH